MGNTSNQHITWKGKPLTVLGRELHVGEKAPPLRLVGNDLQDITSEQFKGKRLVISVVPSLDTSTCAVQTKRFNQEAEKYAVDVVILTVSEDLPFAQARWCGAEGVKNVITASNYKYRNFGDDFGVHIQDLGLLARAVFVVDQSNTITHVEYVENLSAEPDYAAVMKVLVA
jgi:thiol peroxidase